MRSKVIVTFDKSQEDVPTMVVADEGFSYFNPSIEVRKVITGQEAIDLWNKLTLKEQE